MTTIERHLLQPGMKIRTPDFVRADDPDVGATLTVRRWDWEEGETELVDELGQVYDYNAADYPKTLDLITGATKNPTRWKVEPFTIEIEPDKPGTHKYRIYLGDEELDWGWEQGSEDDALREAMSELEDLADKELLDDGVEPFRAPDFETSEGGVWWGPSRDPQEAEAFTEVEGDCVREYAYVGYYEGFDEGQWRVLERCLARPVPKSARLRARVGVDEIAEGGAQETLLDNDEVMGRFGHMGPRKAANPREDLLRWS